MKQLLVLFDNEFDDTVFNKSGDIVTPGGRSYATMLAEALREIGYETTEVYQRSFYGWEFEISTERHRFLAVLQQAETWLIAVGDVSNLIIRVASRESTRELERVANALRDAVVSTKIGSNARIEKSKVPGTNKIKVSGTD